MSGDHKPFTPEALLEVLQDLPTGSRYCVGFSGGADSTALLLALHQLDRQQALPSGCGLQALHFNHGLQVHAGDWVQHCQQFCQQREIPLRVVALSVQHRSGTSPETAAREARYQAIARMLGEGEVYLTAHHADDQAETLFLNLMRGSGLEGLAGIRPLRKFAGGWLARPLLTFRRAALQDFLATEQVEWIRDPSNDDVGPDRNFLRASIFPQLDQRWPGVISRLSRASQHLRDQSNAFRELLSVTGELTPRDGLTLSVKPLLACSPHLQAEVIRHWIFSAEVTPPPRARLHEFLDQLRHLRHDSKAELCWSTHVIRHYNGSLWLLDLPGPAACPDVSWDFSEPLQLGGALGQLQISGGHLRKPMNGRVSSRKALRDRLEAAPSESEKVKEIMRISRIPDWLRDSVPVTTIEGKLAAIADWWLAPGFKQALAEAQLEYRWHPAHPVLQKIRRDCHSPLVDPSRTLV
jgi:tRNA(Ile)-lysidine synthase